MRRSKIVVYLHLVWATKGRQPLMTPELERTIHRCLVSEAEQAGCKVVAIGGMPDHVHMLLRFPATMALADFMKELKGNSSAMANSILKSRYSFRWQEGYAAFSVSRSHVKAITEYVANQKTHHLTNDLHPDWEETDTEYNPNDT